MTIQYVSDSRATTMIPFWAIPLIVIFVILCGFLCRGVLKYAVHVVCGYRQLSANNPFAKDARKPKRTFITDKHMRDALLRKEFDSHNVSFKTAICLYNSIKPRKLCYNSLHTLLLLCKTQHYFTTRSQFYYIM